MSEQEKDENNLGSVGEPPPSPPPTGNVVYLHQYINPIEFGELMDFSCDDPDDSDIANLPYNSNLAGEDLYEKSQGPGQDKVQMYGVLNKYLRDSRNFGILSPLLGDLRRFMRPTIFSTDKYEVTPRIKDTFMKGRYGIIQGKGRRRHCKSCDREVTASHIDNNTGSCAYGSPEWNNCRPMGPAIGDEKIIEVDNDE